MAKLVLIGTVVKPHGLDGSVLVKSDTGQESSLQYVPSLWLGATPENSQEYEITETAWMPKGWKVTLDGVEKIEAAEPLKGLKVFVDREELDETDDDEFYLSDLNGLTAQDENGNKLGRYLRAETPENSTDLWWFEIGGKEIAVPATKTYLKKVDVKAGIIVLANLDKLIPK